MSEFTIRIQHAWDVQVFLSDIEGCVEIFHGVILGEFRVVDQIWTMSLWKIAQIYCLATRR
jgi:hypothetical protein